MRREIVRLHRQIFRANQSRINHSVSGYTAAFRRYEREYMQHVRRFAATASLDELDRELATAAIVYVGDYHTLRQAQRAFLRLLRRLPSGRPVTVALEFVQAKYQHVIDAYLADGLSDEAFLAGIEHQRHWVFGGWPSFREIFALARERGYRVLGIDTVGKGPAGTSLVARDKAAAQVLLTAQAQRPDDLLMVLIGELHIAPTHLPREVGRLSSNTPRQLIVYQNCERLYWRLEERALEHAVEVVRIAERQYCLMNTPPIVCQQSFLNWLDLEGDGESDDAELPSPDERFREYARIIARFFDIDLGDAPDEIEVHTVVDLSFLERLRARADFSAGELRTIKKQILASESYFIPRAKMAYIGNLSVNHAAEEATHFVRHVCAQAVEPRLLVDAFYARVLEEAVGFLGSKLINHKRKCARPDHFRKLLHKQGIARGEKALARLVVLHEAMEQGRSKGHLGEIYECDADTFNAVTHVIGYQLGEKLYYAMVEGLLPKERIRALFCEPFAEEGEALTTYLYLAATLREVTLPERM